MLKSSPILGCVIAGLVGIVVFQARRLDELGAIKPAAPVAPRTVPVAPMVEAGERERLAGELDAARQEIVRLRRAAESKPAAADSIAGRVGALKETLQRLPEQQIPQLVYATEADWYAAVEGPLETPEDFRKAMARLRNSAYTRFGKLLQPALKDYMKANGDRFPQEVLHVQPFLTAAMDPAALQNLRVVPASSIKNVRMGGEWAITQVAVVDSEFDAHIVIGPNGLGSYGGPGK
jgi:hypothetical protein